MKKYKITFKQKKKYNSSTRTVCVEGTDNVHAAKVFFAEYKPKHYELVNIEEVPDEKETLDKTKK